MKEIKTIKPFTRFLMTIGELPSSYLMSMTYEEQLLWFCNFLQNTVVPTVNNNSEAVIELQEYVANYFDNLDVQTEVDHKLDEMAESGELEEIIAAYIDLAAIFGFNTVSDMAVSENLKNGSSVYCLGRETYNDGKGAFYKIREITILDVIDGDNIVAITNSDDLVAEKLPNYEINQINDAIDTINDTTIPGIQDQIDTINNTTIPGIQDDISTINNTTIPGIQDQIDTINNTTIPGIQDDISTINNTTIPGIQDQIDTINNTTIPGIQNEINTLIGGNKILVIGDSYSNAAQSGTPLWYTYIANWHKKTVYTTASDGQGYAVGTNNFLTQLQNAYNDTSLDNDKVSEIYIVGGLNDLGNTSINVSSFTTGVNNTLTYACTNFPNANIIVVGILPFQWYNYYTGTSCFTAYDRASSFQNALSTACCNSSYTNLKFINGEYFGLCQEGYFGSANGGGQRHPSSLGEKMLANFIENGTTKFGSIMGDSNSYIKTTPITCSQGTPEIDFVCETEIGVKIYGYTSGTALDVYMSGLPNNAAYLPCTDETGHTSFLYWYYGAYKLPANAGLSGGTIYFTVPWKLV